MLTGTYNTKENTQVLLSRFDEAEQIVTGLAKVILPRAGEFQSVMEITDEVFEHYYHAKAA